MLLLKDQLSNFLRFATVLLTSVILAQTIQTISPDKRLAEASRRGEIDKAKDH